MNEGVLGGGQLGRMLAIAGYPLGLQLRFMDASAAAAAGQLAELHVGAFDDAAAIEAFRSGLDVVTYEFENVPADAVRFLSRIVPVHPPPEALGASQDRLSEKNLFRRLGIPTPARSTDAPAPDGSSRSGPRRQRRCLSTSDRRWPA